MSDIVKSYNPVVIRNSPIEFVLIGQERGDFRPLLISANCGLDLLGFAASHSYSLSPDTRKSPTSSILSAWRKEDENYRNQFVELKFDSYYSDIVYFYWKGARIPNYAIREVKRIAEINFSIIMNEMPKLRPNDARPAKNVSDRDGGAADYDGFLSWHISPVIKVLNEYNLRARRSRDFIRFVLILYAVMVGFAVLGVTLFLALNKGFS